MFGLMRARTCAKHTGAWREWRNHYCGTCKTIGSRYGQAARMSLNHDTVFLAELLTALSGPLDQSRAYRSFNCMSMPRTEAEMPAVLRYAAAATLVLTEFKVLDHIEDTGRRRWRLLGRMFSRAFQKARRDLLDLNFPVARMEASLRRQSACERNGRSLEEFAAPTAEATRLFFAHGASVVGVDLELGTLGHKFGELAYLLDAFEDFERDAASGAFNALRVLGFEKREAVVRLQALSVEIGELLRVLPVAPKDAAGFASRLQANLDAKLGLRICCTQPRTAARKTRAQRWKQALEFARGISMDSPKWRAAATVGAVAVIAYLAPSHSKAANSPAECLSLGFNLMALGSMFAMSQSGQPPLPPPPMAPVDPNVHPTKPATPAKALKSGSNCGCGSCDCCDCCDTCNCACCACESIDCCSSCACGECCGGCGDCCGSCSCDC